MSGEQRGDETAPGRDGDMGVSSERVGPTGPGQEGTSGTRDVGPGEHPADGEAPPEQAGSREGDEQGEVHPDPPIPPRSGYSSYDPRSD